MIYRLLLIFCFFSLYAQDDNTVIGKLPNGLTYYIRHHEEPKDKVSLRLIVKAGSIHESEEERGVAHFVEHMVFRGSDNFKDGEVYQYIESMGAWFGPDVNAFTTFGYTSYKFDLPLSNPDALKNGLFILSEFAGRALFPKECVEKERTVILDEMNRFFLFSQKLMATDIIDSIHSKRMPIGDKAVLERCSSEELKAFYRKWYRPDRMAVIAVGDIDVDTTVRFIQDHFGGFVSPEEKMVEPSQAVTFLTKEKAVIHVDPTQTFTSFALNTIYFRENVESEDVEEVKFFISYQLLSDILSKRLEKLCALYPDIFLHTWIDDSGLIGDYRIQEIGAACFEGRLQEAITIFNKEIHRFFAHGVTDGEWQKAKEKMKTVVELAKERSSKRASEEIAQDCGDHFLGGKSKAPIDYLRMWDQVDQGIKELVEENIETDLFKPDAESLIFTVMTPSKETAHAFSEGLLLDFVEKTKEGEFTPPENEKEVDWQLSLKYPPGEIVYEESCDEGVVCWQLSNGMRVFVKPTDFQKGEMLLLLAAKGGLTAFAEEEVPSVSLATLYFQMMGLGNLDRHQLHDFLSNRFSAFNLNVGYESRMVVGTSLKKEGQPQIFELMHAFFTEPHMSFNGWNTLLQKAIEMSRQRENNFKTAFYNFIWEKNTQNHFFFRNIDFSQANEGVSLQCLHRLRGNPQDFVAIVVGDVDVSEIRKWTSQYLASIPPGDQKPLTTPSLDSFFIKKSEREFFVHGNPSTSETVITLPVDLRDQNRVLVKATLTLIENRLQERLRKQMGGTYQVDVTKKSPFYPNLEQSCIVITFTSKAEEIDPMLSALFDEVDRLKRDPPSDQETSNLQKMLCNAYQEQEKSNLYWVSKIKDRVFGTPPFEPSFTFTAEDLKQAAGHLFSPLNYTIFSHVPVDKK